MLFVDVSLHRARCKLSKSRSGSELDLETGYVTRDYRTVTKRFSLRYRRPIPVESTGNGLFLATVLGEERRSSAITCHARQIINIDVKQILNILGLLLALVG